MFQHDTAYRLRRIRDDVRIGYSLSGAIDRCFGPFSYQQRGAQWDAVGAYLADARAIGDSDDVAGRLVDAVDAAYREAYRHAAI